MNIRRLVFVAFLVPIIAVAFVSISHVTTWYGIANPIKWATYLSVGVEIAALSALAGFSIKLGRFLYPPLILVTIIQFIGNVFYNFQFIDVDGELFKDWVELTSPLFYMMGVEPTDMSAHKRLLAVLEGGFLPAISLFFMHLLMKIEEMGYDDKDKKEIFQENPIESINEIVETTDSEYEAIIPNEEEHKEEDYVITQEDLEEILEKNEAEVSEIIEEEPIVEEVNQEIVEEIKQEEVEQPQEEVKEAKPNRLHYTK